MKKFIHKIHLWLSVPVGLIISVVCFTGAVLVFETEIKEICNRDRYYVNRVKNNPLPIDQLALSASKELPDSLSIANLQIYADKSKNYRFSTQGRNGISVYVDPYSGDVKDVYNAAEGNFFQTMMQLHRWLLDNYKRDGSISVGKTIVGVTTIIFVLILISGIIIWIPKTWIAVKRRLKIKRKKGIKIFFRDLHVAGGIYAALVLLVLALTGLTWSFSWYRTGFYKLFGAEIQQPSASPQTEKKGNSKGKPEEAKPSEKANRKEAKTVDFSKWQQVSDELKTKNPDFNSLTLQDGKASLSLSQTIGNSRATDNYSFDTSTGEITDSKLYKDQDKATKIRGWIYSVHVGSWGGIVSKFITFFAALLGATLPLTGYYLWLKKHFAKKKRRNKIGN